MLQYCINIFFSGTAIVGVFIVIDSCRKALSEYRLLMQERELMGPVWAAIDPGVTLLYDDRKPAVGPGLKLQGGTRLAISVKLMTASTHEPLGSLPNALWNTPRRVLGGSGEQELISFAVWTSEAQAIQSEGAL